ncbi:uncharacterized protein LOC120350161 [Nilaparvata lugens]|uniref:uncharacterized protein LOC120350161 n=1 Tax=Nilaparvata lugens TaxID=108931 RepID=UPI00193DA62D|nr:uncharacterized protein LOC120350161 [Nilaparvata lugens]XP_039278528.1 uncharacterized protein LOC120350161 [Nilaparvata lugens]XP_039278529.1 uncharacterized protein LOC120350161 [Nilaparvata lugens]XP_039278530.1 uncharacterized protein LOC120350161 [Nilaparvata lugens]XP_039278531.1 uncharacterized protein LOC120350161 [Nilaparvata lugens]XP_039278532.1 uncharacterized protein LOC120350161 [Nilaparvata lugens]
MDASVSNHRVIMEYLQIPSKNDSQISQSNAPSSEDKRLYCLIMKKNLGPMTREVLDEIDTFSRSYGRKGIGESVVPEPADVVTMTAPADVTMTAPADATMTAPADITMTSPVDVTMTAPADVTMTAPADAMLTSPADVTMTSSADVTMTAPADSTMTKLADVTMTAPADAVTMTESVTGRISADSCQQLLIAPENIEITDNSQQESNGKIYDNASVEKIFQDYTKLILRDDDNEGYASSSRGDALSLGLKYLAPAMKDTSVISLNLGWCGLSSPTIIHFAKNLHSSNLKKLILCANLIDEDDEKDLENAFKDSGIEWLDVEADPICDHPLSSYDDYDGPPIEIDMHYLDQCRNNPEKTTLNLEHCKQIVENGPSFLLPILKSSYIKDLNMASNNLSCDHIKLFASSLMETKLTHLDLGHNNLRYEGIKYLASALKNTRITHLNLQFNSLTCNTLRNLVFALPETRITDLNLSGNAICCNAFYLACVLKNTQISDLDLMYCATKTNHLKHFKDCFQISSEYNNINMSGYNLCSVILYNISRKIKETNIIDLELSCIGINNDDLEYLCHGLVGSKVQLLDLSKNNMNCKGVQILCGVLEHTHISQLDLAQNRISCDGIKHLAQVLPRTKISKLNLAYNEITCIGVKQID